MSDITTQNPFAPPLARVSEPVTGDSLVEATRGSRLAAAILDGLIPGAVAAVLGICGAVAIPALGHDSSGGLGAAIVFFALFAVLIVGWLVVTGVMVYRYSQTIGKRIMGIRVVRTDGSRAAFGRILGLRVGVMMVLGFIPLLGPLVGLIDSLLIFRDSSKCLHDDIADTRVVTAASSQHATLAGSLA
jgi:uncharacterized RDD family membrane protein YckC